MTLFSGSWISIWQFSGLPASHSRIEQVARLARARGASGVLVKAFDGEDWMTTSDSGADALGSVDQVARQRAICGELGLSYGIWVNPLHGDRGFIQTEAQRYAAAANAAGLVIWATEPHFSAEGEFWGPHRPPGDARRLIESFRALAPDCVNVWQPGGRPAQLEELRPAEWGQHMQVYAPRAYWASFQQGVSSTLAEAFLAYQTLLISGQLSAAAEWAPTLPANANAEELRRGISIATSQGALGRIFCHLGEMGPAQLAVVQETAG